MTRAGIYVRVSSASQADEDSVSLEQQEEACLAYCRERAYEVVRVYTDVESGTSRRRQQFQAMLESARAGELDRIVAWKLDRLNRGVRPLIDLMDAVEPFGVEIEAVRDSVDQKYLGLMAAVAQLEVDGIRERMALGKIGRAKEGRVPVRRLPYGYRIDADRRPQIHEYKAGVVRRIYQLALDGMGSRKIAERLTSEGVRTPSGGPRWLCDTVQPILANETYTGTWRYGQRRVRTVEGGRMVTPTDRAEQILVSVPIIIDRQTWEMVQKLKMARRGGNGGKPRRWFYMLSRLVRCTECGMILSGTARDGGKLRYYRCGGVTVFGLRCRERVNIRADRLERIVWAEVEDWLTDPEAFYRAVDSDDRADALADDIRHAEKELAKVTAEEDRAVRLYVSGEITEAQLGRQRKFITERLEHSRERLHGLRAQQTAEHERAAMLDSLTAWMKRIRARLADLDDEGRKAVVQQVLDGVTIDAAGHVRINFAVPLETPGRTAGSTSACTPLSAD